MTRTLGVAVAVAAFVAAPSLLHAQRRPTTRPELRIDATSAHVPRLELSGGVAIPIGTYVRLALTAGTGVARVDDAIRQAGRGDAIIRFELDPLKQSTRGAYVGGGLSFLGRDGSRARGYLAVVGGLELKQRGGWVPAVEAGLGGGARLGVVLKRAMENWR